MEWIVLLLIVMWWVWRWLDRAKAGRAYRGWHRRACAWNHGMAAGQRKPDWVRRELVTLDRQLNGSARFGEQRLHGCRSIAAHFNRLHAGQGMQVGKSHVAQVLSRQRLAELQARKAMKHRVPEAQACNDTWGLDATWLEGRWVLGAIDHGSRAVVALRTVRRLNAWTALGVLCLGIGQWGRPGKVRTDNASIFHGRTWRWGLKLIGITRQYTQPGQPWHNGRIERLFGTLKRAWKHCPQKLKDAFELRLAEFVHWHNEARPHQHLGGCTPREIWDTEHLRNSTPWVSCKRWMRRARRSWEVLRE